MTKREFKRLGDKIRASLPAGWHARYSEQDACTEPPAVNSYLIVSPPEGESVFTAYIQHFEGAEPEFDSVFGHNIDHERTVECALRAALA